MSNFSDKLKNFSELIKLEHSLFALPFAFMGSLLAAEGIPSFKVCTLVVLCMFFARTAGMTFNRLLDAKFDKDNPRTADRAIPAGTIKASTAWIVSFVCLAGLSYCAYLLNPLAFYLSPLCHIMLFGYSLTKRFTWGCHIFLGAVEAFAPIGGWIAVKGSVDEATPIYLGLATVFWIAGLDVVYATQDAEFDKERKLHSIPARFGVVKSFYLAGLFHVITMVLVILAGMTYQAGIAYWIGSLIVAGLFVYQHTLVSPTKKDKLNFAFFGVNSWISFILMLTTLAETLIEGPKV